MPNNTENFIIFVCDKLPNYSFEEIRELMLKHFIITEEEIYLSIHAAILLLKERVESNLRLKNKKPPFGRNN